jgi:hypothetical protein
MGSAMLTRTLALALSALTLSACDIDAQPDTHNDNGEVRESSDEPGEPGDPREPGDPEQPVPGDSGYPGDEGGEGCGGEPEPLDPEAEPYPHSPGVAVGAAIVDCDVEAGSELVTWQSEAAPELALYVASIRATRDVASDGEATGEADLHFDRPGASVLALTAFDATHWNVTVGAESGLTRVILIGYGEQTATVPEGVELETWHESHSACGYTLPFDGEGGCNTDLLLASLEAHTGAPLFRFDGCASASIFDYAQ